MSFTNTVPVSAHRPRNSVVVIPKGPGEEWLTMNQISELGYNTREEYDMAMAGNKNGEGSESSGQKVLILETSPSKRMSYNRACA